ncbi:MAG: hypothetical protein MUC46_06805, partial [Desulfobacterales bacterium]|nr:hypothetical protein [Desulfobacterales bacterium]
MRASTAARTSAKAAGSSVQSRWVQRSPVRVDERAVGSIEVVYLHEAEFLPEEQKLLGSIADRLGQFLFQRRQRGASAGTPSGGREWRVVLDLIERSDPRLFAKISRKMLNYLCWIGIDEARLLLQSVGHSEGAPLRQAGAEANKPSAKKPIRSAGDLSRQIF